MLTSAELLDQFKNLEMDAAGVYYLQFHIRRYQALLKEVARVLPAYGASPLILDVGMAYQTVCIANNFPEASVRTAGFFDCRFSKLLSQGRHTQFDLNDVRFPERIPTGVAEHDVVIVAEVIEHLYSPAKMVLECIKGWMKPGGTLILQTPNPVSLGKRVAALRGVNPFEMIRNEPTNPGHFCEFRVEDICGAVEAAGLKVISLNPQNYFGRQSWIYDALCRILPGSLYDGITLTARK